MGMITKAVTESINRSHLFGQIDEDWAERIGHSSDFEKRMAFYRNQPLRSDIHDAMIMRNAGKKEASQLYRDSYKNPYVNSYKSLCLKF